MRVDEQIVGETHLRAWQRDRCPSARRSVAFDRYPSEIARAGDVRRHHRILSFVIVGSAPKLETNATGPAEIS